VLLNEPAWLKALHPWIEPVTISANRSHWLVWFRAALRRASPHVGQFSGWGEPTRTGREIIGRPGIEDSATGVELEAARGATWGELFNRSASAFCSAVSFPSAR
jgi:hypothetical protein